MGRKLTEPSHENTKETYCKADIEQLYNVEKCSVGAHQSELSIILETNFNMKFYLF